MLHANQAGTSWPKPMAVRYAAAAALDEDVGDWPTTFVAQHERVARAFGIQDPARLLLTPGGTSALAVGIADHPWASGDRLLISAMEHHALHRPATALEGQGVVVEEIPRAPDGPFDLGAFDRALAKGEVRLVALTAAANVTGELLPIPEVVAQAHAAGALVLVDASQLAGWMPIDVEAWDVDLLAFTGHKALHAPWGIGGLYVHPRVTMRSPLASCAVPQDGEAPDCATMPGYCDVGSVDRAALAGLAAAVDWLEEPAQADRLDRVRAHMARVEAAVRSDPEVRLLADTPLERRLPVVAFTHRRHGIETLARHFAERGIAVGAGALCAPRAHEALGTAPQGVIRLSLGPLVAETDLAHLVEVCGTLASA